MAKVKTAEQTSAPGKTKKKVGLKIFLGVVIALAAFIAVTAVVTVIGNRANTAKAQSFAPVEYGADRLEPQRDADGWYSFEADREVKVLQLTDVHIGGGWMSLKKDAMALNAVAAMVTAEKPDFVIVTGDIGYPVPFQAGTFNNKASAKIFAALMERLGVYWTLTFGNHDTELYSYYSREKMADYYENSGLKYCLFQTGPADVDGCGNQVLRIRNGAGLITQALYLFDSHSYTGGDFLGILWKYDNIHENQIEWYKAQVEANDAANRAVDPNAAPIKSAAFFHIPLREYKTAWEEYVNNGFQDTADVKYAFGTAGETGKVVYCGIGDDEVFETFAALGSTKAVFCGHDHYNNFSLDYKGIRLTYGMSVDYLAYPGIYKNGSQRGCTVLTFAPDGALTVTPESYYQDKYRSQFAKEDVTMQEIVPITDIEQ